jgi:hypothetical protein
MMESWNISDITHNAHVHNMEKWLIPHRNEKIIGSIIDYPEVRLFWKYMIFLQFDKLITLLTN